MSLPTQRNHECNRCELVACRRHRRRSLDRNERRIVDPALSVLSTERVSDARVPSPAATGGAGTTFEARVGAIALSRLLRGDRFAGIDGPAVRVRLQQRVAGHQLDDVVIDGEDPRGGSQSIEYQVKRTMSIVASDVEFVDIINRCLAALDADDGEISGGRRRFGIATRPSPALGELDRVVRAARAHDTAGGFVDTLRATAGEGVRKRLEVLRGVVAGTMPAESTDAAIDAVVWRVAQALHIWPVDGEPDSGDVLATLDRLDDLVHDGGDAGVLFSRLTDAVQEWAPQAGSTDLPMLRARLERVGIALDAAPSRRRSFERLAQRSETLLDPAAATFGHSLHLPRRVLRLEIRSLIDGYNVVLLAGRAGVGKSVAARLVANDVRNEGATAVVLNLAGRVGPLALLEQDLQTSLGDALDGAPIGGTRLLVVDGAEQALADGGALLSAVLAALPPTGDSAPPWRVLLTARDEAVGTIQRLVSDRLGSSPHTFTVGELDDEEIAAVVDAFPRLAPVARNARARSLLLRRPYLVELLVRTVETRDLPGDVTGEEDVLVIVNDRLIRLDGGGLPGRGAPYARADIFRALGDAVLNAEIPAALDGSDAEARAGLASDDVTVEKQSRWRFAHDILADYAATWRLLEPDGNVLLGAAPHPRRLLRSVRLRMQRQLGDAVAGGDIREAWANALAEAVELSTSDGPRWLDVPWEALLHLGTARRALDQLREQLIADDGALLLRLIDVTERLARHRDADETEGHLLLDTTLAGPVVDLLVEHAAALPTAVTSAAARLVRTHLEAAAAQHLPDADGLERAADVPDAVVSWAGDDRWGDRLEHVITALALSAAHLDARHEEFLEHHARTRPDEIAAATEAPRPARSLARARPSLLLRLAGLYYLGIGLRVDAEDEHRRADGEDDDDDEDDLSPDDEGVRDHSMSHRGHLAMWPLGNNQSNPALGPFAPLLEASPEHGLRLVGAVVDAATIARTHVEATWGDGDGCTLLLTAPEWNDTRQFTGPRSVWMWHRRTSVGAAPALSAAMALRAWGVRLIRDGESPAAVRDALLGAGTSLAFASVALSVLTDRLDDLVDEIDPFLDHPLVWSLENGRVTHEHGGTALEIPDANHLSWSLSQVAMMLVLRGDNERRSVLRTVGERLIAHHDELADDDSELLARRWAAELDWNRYITEARDEGVVIAVDYPADVMAELQARGGGRAALSIRLSGLMMRSIQIRDGKADLADAASVWAESVAGCEEQAADDGYGVYQHGDILSAAGAALVLAAAAGEVVDDGELQRAVGFLIDGAAYFGQAAPPATVADVASDRSHIHDQIWDVGADRSIAVAMPALLLDARLRDRAGVALEVVDAALVDLAASPYDEAKARLAAYLLPGWTAACDRDELHGTLLRVARRLIATQGRARLPAEHGYGYGPVMLAEPLEDTIRAASGIGFDLGGASFAVRLLAGAKCDCVNGQAATALLDLLIDYDQRVWPASYARHHYHRTGYWRQAIDAVVADRVMGGDDAALNAHLDAHACVGEELVGFLSALVERATDALSTTRLHEIWDPILDRLLPGRRDLSPRDGHRDREPWSNHVDELDRALLLIPPDDRPDWPFEETFRLGVRWLKEYESAPQVADHAIRFVGHTLGIANDIAIHLILLVLGDDLRSIRRSSQFVGPWLQVILTKSSPSQVTGRARALLDRLAADGDEFALSVQQELER